MYPYDETPPKSMFDGGYKALNEVAAIANQASQASYNGYHGGSSPINAHWTVLTAFDNARRRREDEEAALRAAASRTNKPYILFDTPESPVVEAKPYVPSEKEIAAGIAAEAAGYHGLPLVIGWLSEAEQKRYLQGRKNFIDDLQANPVFASQGFDESLYVIGKEYSSFHQYRTYDPIIVAKKALDGVPLKGACSEGARVCHKQAYEIGKVYRKYLNDDLIPYQKERARRDAMGFFRRELIDGMEPIYPPRKSSEVRHAEWMLELVEWKKGVLNSYGITGSCLTPKTQENPASSPKQEDKNTTSQNNSSGPTERRGFREVPPRPRKQADVNESSDVKAEVRSATFVNRYGEASRNLQDVEGRDYGFVYVNMRGEASTDFNAVSGKGVQRAPKGPIDFGRYTFDRKYRSEIDFRDGPQ